ncbi:MAG: hemolysin family protein [Acidimicrobiia bacterium]
MAYDLALIAALILVNAAFAGTELAIVSLREGQLRRLAREGGERGRRVAHLAQEPTRFLATIQIGITLAGFLASATAAVSLSEPLEERLDFLGEAAAPAAIVLVTFILTFFTLVLGELAPKRVAMQRAERWAVMAARPVGFLAALARPVVWLLSRATDLAVRIMGGDPRAVGEDIPSEEVRDLAARLAFSPLQRQIIDAAFEIAERTVRDILVPRPRVLALQVDLPAREARRQLRAQGHSRAPVYTEDLDDADGVVHIRDLADFEGRVGEAASAALVLPETVGALEALRQLQLKRQSLALVVNEYGGTEGIITVEDLLEELVGEIYDEADRDVRGVERQPDGTTILPGSFPMHDLVDLDVELPESEAYSTVAGLVLDQLGHLPKPGEALTVDSWRIEVLAVDGRAIRRVRLRPVPPDSGGAAPDERSAS